MNVRRFLVAMILGVGLVVALMLLFRPAPPVHADPGIYHVQEGESIQQAIHLAASPGDEVWVAVGVYTENLVITRGVKLRGGWNVSFTVQSPVTYPTVIDGNGALVISVMSDSDPTSLEDFILRDGQDGVHVLTGQVTVERCTIQDMAKQGLEIENGTVLISVTQILTTQRGVEVDGGAVQVKDVHIAHASEEGLLIERGGAVTFTGSIIEDCAQQGVQINNGSLWLFDNLIRDIQVDGIHVEGGAVSIISNTVHTTLADGVDVSGTQVISGNLVTGAGDHGISAHHGAATIVNNVVHDTGGDGIHTTGTSTDVEIRGNTVYNTDKDGIDGRGQTVAILSNTIHDSDKDGVHIENAGDTHVQQNTIYETDEDGVHVEDAGDTRIQQNTVCHANDDGIDVWGATVLVANNVVSGCADNGIKAADVGSWVHVEANWVLSNATIGIAVRQAPVFTLTNNVVGDHISGSVELGGTTGVGFVYHNTLVGSMQGTGLAVLAPLTVTLANNIVVSHNVGISATAGSVLSVSHTLLRGNGHDPISGTNVITGSPLFVAPASQDYHLLPDSPAIDAGMDVGVLTDVDGNPRPLGDSPDVGADEVYAGGKIYLPLVLRDHPPSPPDVPLYKLYAAHSDLAWLATRDPYDDEPIPALFTHERSWEVDIRYRGDTSRLMPKKCWRVFFPGSDLFQGQEEINLNADYPDQTLLRSYVGYDFLTRVGVPTPHAGYARLHINDNYQGLFSQVEQVDKRFLHSLGIEMHGNLYKAYYGNLAPEVNDWWYDYHYQQKTNQESGHKDLVAFIQLINQTPDAQFPEAIANVLDVNEWLDWYAVNILIGNFEMMDKNYYLYHDFSTDRWIVLSWDVDIALGHNAGAGGGGYGHLLDTEISWDNPIDSGTQESKKIDGKYNKLIDRMMNVPEFRLFHCRRLEELMADEFSPAEMFPRIDDTFSYIRSWAEADPYRWQPEGFEFSNGPNELKTYITNRIQFLKQEMPDFCPDLEIPLTINELMAVNASVIADEAGDYDGWIEVYNGSSTLAWDLGGMYLSDDLDKPTKWRIPDDTLVPPGGTLLFWADNEEQEGSLHTNLALSDVGGWLGLFDRDVFGNAPISVLTYTAQAADVSYGRMPDGSGSSWQSFTMPTPGWPNEGLLPVVGDVAHTPPWPSGGKIVTVTAVITDEGIVTATLWYRAFAPGISPPAYLSAPMVAAGGNLHTVVIPAQADGTWVEYYLEAKDEAGMVTMDRPGWPQGDYRYIVGWQRPPLYINEVMALNTHTLEDEYGDHDDWAEIYNAGSAPINLSGMYLSDNITEHTYWQIPDGAVVLGGGYLLIWLDGEHWTETPLHGSFRLAGDGEQMTLYDSRAHYYAPIDAVYFPPQAPNISWGRFSDGGDEWYAMTTPTPGKPNLLRPPQFLEVTRTPAWPGANEGVTVTAVVTAGSPVVSATLWYDVGNGFQAAPMIGNITCTANIPPQPEGALVKYYLEAIDGGGQGALHPPAAPDATYSYLVGYAPPPVLINEFLADNERVNQDEAGEYDDWLELYNSSATTATLDGMYLTDDLAEPQKWQFSAGTTIPPGGHLLVWCDKDEEQGSLHTSFKLSADGEEIGLFDSEAHGLISLDWVIFGPQPEDISYGRQPDGSNSWNFLDPPSPGASNE